MRHIRFDITFTSLVGVGPVLHFCYLYHIIALVDMSHGISVHT
jgi:hypothetical protein